MNSYGVRNGGRLFLLALLSVTFPIVLFAMPIFINWERLSETDRGLAATVFVFSGILAVFMQITDSKLESQDQYWINWSGSGYRAVLAWITLIAMQLCAVFVSIIFAFAALFVWHNTILMFMFLVLGVCLVRRLLYFFINRLHRQLQRLAFRGA